MLKCDKCSYEFELNKNSVKETIVNMKDGCVTIVYFSCPKCKKIYKILLKDKVYDKLREDLEKVKERIRKNAGSNNKEFVRILLNMACKKQERLQRHVLNVHQKYDGTFVFDMSEDGIEQIVKYLP